MSQYLYPSESDSFVSLEKELNEELEIFLNEEKKHDNEFQTQIKEIAILQGYEDGENEDIENKLQSLKIQIEDYDKRLADLQNENHRLLKEIETLKDSQNNINTYNANLVTTGEENLNLEYMLAETRSKLARAQQAQEDQALARELAEKEMMHEKILRLHAEKGP